MKLLQSRLFYAFVAWLPVFGIVAWLYTKLDFPGSVPLYVWILLRISGAVATMITAILAGVQVFEITRKNLPSLIVAVGTGAIFWVLTTNVVRILFYKLGI